ncbi:MAG: hypothetical protein AAF747_03310, partial [Planctomycetota bacterium]
MHDEERSKAAVTRRATGSGARIAWLLPPLIEGSGGIRTMLHNAEALTEAGHRCDIYIQHDMSKAPPTAELEASLRRELAEMFDYHGEHVYAGFRMRSEYDLAIATAWWTAFDVARLAVPKKAYFVQDYEAMFSPMGDGYLMAENSYSLGLTPITIGRWLSHTLATRYGNQAAWFEFCADRNAYRPNPTIEREKAVCFIYQPEKPRRCPKLGFETLRIVKNRRPKTKILLYGTREP